ncbi:MAG: HAMP domain-containing histidine kinase [Oscillospiraceae bacterium]|nr:HAMP domain-containing histidine kinase [Oscillospiraceae bacterium]
MLKKLRLKFILITMALVLVMLTVIFSMVYTFTKGDLDEQNRSTMLRLSQMVNKPGGLSQPPRDVRTPWFVLRLSGGMITAVGYTGYDLDDEAFLNEILEKVRQEERSEGVLDEYHLMYRKIGNKLSQSVVFLDISGYKATLRALVESCIGIGAVSLAVFWIISFFLARWAVKPVEQAWDRQRQFVSDASHELKTPLTVIMSNAELIGTQQQLPEAAGKYAQNIQAVSHQMKGLVESMLELARVDNGQVKKSFARIDFSDMVGQSLLEFEPVLFEKGLALEAAVQPAVYVTGNGRYLKQLADILLDNAGKYSDTGVVTVQLLKQGKTCLLTVANPGCPIPAEEQEKIFERFYRADQARSRNGSFGLGLSIAQSVVQEHRGKIWVRSNPTGNCFCVQLPCE